MIAEKIPKTIQTLEERGVPNDSYFTLVFEDDSEVNEKTVTWFSLSEKRVVDFFGQKKIVMVCKVPVKKIKCFHRGLEAEIDVPKDCEVYQAIRGESLIVLNVQRKDSIIGRLIGIVKNREVVEELFLNELQNKVEGVKK